MDLALGVSLMEAYGKASAIANDSSNEARNMAKAIMKEAKLIYLANDILTGDISSLGDDKELIYTLRAKYGGRGQAGALELAALLQKQYESRQANRVMSTIDKIKSVEDFNNKFDSGCKRRRGIGVDFHMARKRKNSWYVAGQQLVCRYDQATCKSKCGVPGAGPRFTCQIWRSWRRRCYGVMRISHETIRSGQTFKRRDC
jgi:hypothetical protein